MIQKMVGVARGLAGLPARPPTPPQEYPASEKASQDTKLAVHLIGSSTTDTPDLFPSSSAESTDSSSDKSQKRVGFSPWNEYHKAPLMDADNNHERPLKPLPPSKERHSKLSKSILKPFVAPTPMDLSENLPVYNHENFAAMLESMVQQLASGFRSSRLDAYVSLSGMLKACDGVPDSKAMADKMGLLTQFIQRDLYATSIGTKSPDTLLITQALKLLSIFIWTPSISHLLSEDFQSFVLDRAICILEDPQMPKAIVNQVMHLLTVQRFKSRILSTERANRLITALDNIQNHVTGNGIVDSRLVIYKRLLAQVPSVMVSRIADWLDHVFSGMLSSTKLIRCRAIAFGIDAGLSLGTVSTVSEAVMDLFDRSGDGKKFADFFCETLNEMLTSSEDGAYVPQIWSVPVLFLRSGRHQLDHWEHMKAWLYIIQKCFNSSDILVKFQANVAWNRLVFAINPDTLTGPVMMKMLRQPIVSQLDRTSADKHSKQARQVALGGYCNILYYALNPSATHKQLDIYWTQYVSQVFGNAFLSSAVDLDLACQMLKSWLGDAQPKPWNENRANEKSPTKPEELPRLDPKWVRSRASAVIEVFEQVFRVSLWPHTLKEAAPVKQAWGAFMTALGDAGNKEVKVSTECMEAVGEIFNMLQRIWTKGPFAIGVDLIIDDKAFVEGFGLLVEMAIDHLGPLPFTDKLLLRTENGSFQGSVTPLSKSSCTDGSQHSPIMHLLGFFSRPQGCLMITEQYGKMVEGILHKAIQCRTSEEAQLEVLGEWTRVFQADFASTADTLASSCILKAITKLMGSSPTDVPYLDGTSDNTSLETQQDVVDEGFEAAPLTEANLETRDGPKPFLTVAYLEAPSPPRDAEPDLTETMAPQNSKKRKRQNDHSMANAKKPKTSPPHKDVHVSIEVPRRTPVEVEEELFDCIIVDSSPVPVSPKMAPVPVSPAQSLPGTPSGKRRPGRPRKGASKSPLPCSEDISPSRPKKRKASLMEYEETGAETTSAPPTKKQRTSPPPLSHASAPRSAEDGSDVFAATASSHHALQPSNGNSILDALRRIFKEVQQVVLGKQEEREVDEVLFEIRKEVHEAGRRGAQ